MKYKNLFRITGGLAVLFGLVTIRAGGSVLFGDEAARQAAGHYVPFVLIFNFVAGFAYIAAGAGLLAIKRWAAILAGIIAVANLTVFAALGVHIFMGGEHETRTVLAMIFRTVIWAMIFAVAYRYSPSAGAAPAVSRSE